MLSTSTKNSINKKIDEINSLLYSDTRGAFCVYQKFHNANSNPQSRQDISKLYTDSVDLAYVLTLLSSLDPYSTPLEHRKNYKFGFRQNEGCLSQPITKETLIQRNLFLNTTFYRDCLGDLIGYEIVIPRKKRAFPVDLVGIKLKDNKPVITLIELKSCILPSNTKAQSKELLLRAILEVATYKAWFCHALQSETDGLCSSIQCQLARKLNINLSLDEVKNLDVENIVLVPDTIARDVQFLDEKLYSGVKIYLINPSELLKEDTKTGDVGRYFDIVKF